MPQTKLQHRVAFSIIGWACLFEFVSAVVVLILSVLTIYITSSTENMHSLHHHQEGTFKRSEISATWLSYVLSIARNASAVFQTQTIVSSSDEASEYWILNREKYINYYCLVQRHRNTVAVYERGLAGNECKPTMLGRSYQCSLAFVQGNLYHTALCTTARSSTTSSPPENTTPACSSSSTPYIAK